MVTKPAKKKSFETHKMCMRTYSCMACTQNCRYFIFTFIRISSSLSEKGNIRGLFRSNIAFFCVTQKKYAFSSEWNAKNPNCDLIRWYRCTVRSVNLWRRFCIPTCDRRRPTTLHNTVFACSQELFVQHVNKMLGCCCLTTASYSDPLPLYVATHFTNNNNIKRITFTIQVSK